MLQLLMVPRFLHSPQKWNSQFGVLSNVRLTLNLNNMIFLSKNPKKELQNIMMEPSHLRIMLKKWHGHT